MGTLYKVTLVLTILGALNWGMIGIFDFDLVASLFGTDVFITKLVYSLIGLCGIINIGLLVTPIERKVQR